MKWFRLGLGLTVFALLIGSSWLSPTPKWIVTGVCVVLVAGQIALLIRDHNKRKASAAG